MTPVFVDVREGKVLLHLADGSEKWITVVDVTPYVRQILRGKP